jgi:hypothetical protein
VEVSYHLPSLPSVRPPARPSIPQSVSPSVSSSVPSARPAVGPLVRPVRPSARPAVCPSVRPLVSQSVGPLVRLVRPPARPPDRPSFLSSVPSARPPPVRQPGAAAHSTRPPPGSLPQHPGSAPVALPIHASAVGHHFPLVAPRHIAAPMAAQRAALLHQHLCAASGGQARFFHLFQLFFPIFFGLGFRVRV